MYGWMDEEPVICQVNWGKEEFFLFFFKATSQTSWPRLLKKDQSRYEHMSHWSVGWQLRGRTSVGAVTFQEMDKRARARAQRAACCREPIYEAPVLQEEAVPWNSSALTVPSMKPLRLLACAASRWQYFPRSWKDIIKKSQQWPFEKCLSHSLDAELKLVSDLFFFFKSWKKKKHVTTCRSRYASGGWKSGKTTLCICRGDMHTIVYTAARTHDLAPLTPVSSHCDYCRHQ